MIKLDIFINRLKRIGIDIELYGNYPWIYIDSINGKKVTEKFQADHGFTVAFLTNGRMVENKVENISGVQFTDIKEIFILIRKYVKITEEVK